MGLPGRISGYFQINYMVQRLKGIENHTSSKSWNKVANGEKNMGGGISPLRGFDALMVTQYGISAESTFCVRSAD